MQICRAEWTEETAMRVRYFANTGGHMPLPLLNKLRTLLPRAKPYLMYGLTEAFRSTYLDPAEIDRRPGSIGKAIPNNRVHVLRADGTPCNPREIGELVHEGATVSLGYWRSPELNEERFRPDPQGVNARCAPMAVWSGDLVWKDEEDFLYFSGRRDEMIKTSGYRVSPTEIEDVVLEFPGVHEAVAVGLPDPELGHSVALAVACSEAVSVPTLLAHCKKVLPAYQVPRRIMLLPQLPRNSNGKFDRSSLRNLMTEQPEGVA
jgi:acyl-coenzyme A synthetase/AMP-(fatty) acid ligase